MGLSIYYNGKLNSPASLPLLVEEVKEVCEAHGWGYDVFETIFPKNKFSTKFTDNAYGICFGPPKCEPICLCFSSKGQLITPWLVEYDIKKGKKENEIILGAFTKTQYAGVKAHQLIIDLLRYLNKKYFSEFKLIDESRYWETEDKKLLRDNFKRYDDLMDNFGLALDTISKKKGETLEEYFKRVAGTVHSNEKKK